MDGRVREVNFRQRSEVSYDGDVSDESNKRYFFKWELRENQWQMDPQTGEYPLWISNNIAVIREAFLTELL